jgi:hypothetical protein
MSRPAAMQDDDPREVGMHYRRTAVWQKSMALAVGACRLAAELPRDERFTIRPQIVRAATSVASNIAEGLDT